MRKLLFKKILLLFFVSFAFTKFANAQPPNDNPCSAIAIPVGASCTFTQYTNAAATATPGVPNPGCASYSGGDVWFSAVVPASGSITFDTNTGVVTDGGMAIYSGTCAALTLLSCNDDGSANGLMPSITQTGLTPGSTVFIRFWEYGNDNDGTFSICATAGPSCSGSNTNATCAAANPFCTGVSYDYCNTTGVPSIGGSGMYGCLLTAPNPAFYFMNIATGGPITFNISQQTFGGVGIDVDFVLWGPFASQAAMCGSIAAGNIVDCSYSTAAVETATIANALPGQWYMMLITNYSDQPGVINFNQTNTGTPGAGATNCNILTATPGVCSAGMYTLTGAVTVPSPPATGTLTVTNSCGGSQVINAPFTSPINYSIPNICGNGNNCTVSAAFSAGGAPVILPTTYTAPSCNTLTATPGGCTAGQYVLSGTLTTGCLPATGTLTISSSCGGSVVFNAPFTSPLAWSLPASNGNGGNCTVTAVYSAAGAPIITPFTFTEPSCCGSDAGTVTVTHTNGTQTTLANGTTQVVLCPNGTASLVSNNNYSLPASGCLGCVPGLMYAIYTAAGPTNPDPDLDPNWTGYYWTGEDFTTANSGGFNSNTAGSCSPLLTLPSIPGYGSTSSPTNTLLFVPITADATDLPNHDANGDGCFDIGNPVSITFLNPISFQPTPTCTGSVSIGITGGYPEFFPALYTLTNTGAGTLASTTVTSGGNAVITGLNSGQTYSFSVNDGNGCTSTFSGVYSGAPTVNINPASATVCTGGCVALNATVTSGVGPGNLTFTSNQCAAIPDAGIGAANGSPTAVPGNWAHTSINVTGVCAPAWNTGELITVCLDISHTFDGDLNIWLQAPNGTYYLLSQDNGGGNANYSNTCFSATAATNITGGTAPFSAGPYLPQGGAGTFAGLNGTAINGSWSLWVADDALGDVGTLNHWSVTFANENTYTYTWAPAAGLSATNILNPNACPAATTTYSLTVTNSCGCPQTATTTITVNPLITPAFAAVAAICSGDPLAPLPTTSTNGINGTWAPALNNTATTTYTFTPAAGQCALTTTLTITVNPLITPTFAAVAPICSGDPLAPLPTTSTNGINGTWAPALNNTATTTYTFTPAAGQCALTTTLTITVNPLITPTFAAVAPICSGDPLAPLPTTSTNGINGTWAPALNNTATTTYTFTPAAGQCALTTTLTITVNPLITPTFAAVAPICSGDPLAPLPTTSTNGINGTWAPALNNTATTTYTFTPAAGQCAVTTTLTITVNPLITPTFAAVAPICSGDPLAPLPTTSTNGINGTWAPALNNTATTTYTFTPAAGQCAVTTTLTITVNPLITPTFAAVAPICSGDPLAPLPTTSTNGINGTWAPALNNTATTTYTFTPAAGQCAVTTTLTITVNPLITPAFAAVAPICSGDPLAPLPTTSTNGINGTWAPALNNTATTTYTFTPAAGQCAVTTTLTITVNPLITPAFAAVAPICSGDPLAPLPTTSTNGINGTWAPALNNTATTTYTFTPAAGQCAVTTTLTITVNPLITPTFAAVAPICSGDPLAPLPTTSTNGINGTWAPALNNTATTTYTFTPAAGQCAVTTTLTITVNPLITPAFAAVAPICSGDPLAPLPTTSTNGINGTWAPALNNTATTTYTFTPAAGQCAVTTTLTITVNPLITPAFAAVAPICSGDPLAPLPTTSTNGINGTWAPALNNTATTTYTFTPAAGQCAVTTTLTITVNPLITPAFAAVAPICSGDPLAPLPTTSTNGINGTWAPALNNTATTTYTFTPAAGQCAVTTTLTITVNPLITPAFAAVAAICSGDPLAPLPTTSTNGINGTWAPALNNTATTTYTFTPAAGQCALTTTLTITVNPLITPTFAAVAPICSGDPLAPLPTTSTNGINGTWAPALNNTATTTYTFTPAAGQCAVTTTLTITVNPLITPAFAAVAPICSGDPLAPLPTTSTNGINGTWAPALNNTATTTYTFTPAAGQCAVTTTLTITVNPLITPAFAAVAPICSGDPLAPLPTTSTNGINGTWAPALNNTATTTYTFTPATGQCAVTTTLTITVNPLITPTFAAVAPICSGDPLAPLPTTSTNGINGTWAPALNNTATTTYTFTPAAGQCAVTTTLTITVNPLITPAFAAVAAICSGDPLAPLPTTSTNGINGTWAPALNNTATTTYTFTPAAGQCAVTTTLTITVNPLITPAFAAVAPICSGDPLAPLPTTSTNGINGTWAPALNNTATTTYTFTPTVGQCAVTTTLTITVNPLITPTFAAVAPICSGDPLAPLPTTSINGINGTWAPALNNTATTTYTFTPAAGQCAVTTTLTITVNPLITPAFAAVAPICSGDPLAPLPTTSTNGINGTWAPALNNTATTTYTFTPAAGQCAVTTTLTITVNPLITPTFVAVAPICSGDPAPVLPTTSTNGITGTWTPATVDNTVSANYTFVPTPGQCALSTTLTVTVNPLITPTFNPVAAICSGDPLAPLPTTSINGINGTWAPALNNTATTTYTFTPAAGQCAVTTTLTITVNPLITPTFAAVAPICSGDPAPVLPTTSTNGITGTWTPATVDNTVSANYTFVPTPGQCALSTTLTITVNPLITPTFAAVAPICSGDPLAPLPTTSTNGINGTWAPALNNTATTTYTFTPAAGQCAVTTTLTITVNPLITPAFAAVAPICSGDPLAPLPTTSTNGINGTWAPALNNTATTTYTFTPAAGQCAVTTTLTITVNPLITPAFAAVAPICSGDPLAPLPTTSTNGINGTWAPALNNTATTTYTFTPAAGQCAVTTTLTITVNPLITPAFAAVAAICSGDPLAPLPTTSTNGINGTWAPALNNTATTTYTFTPAAGQCALTTTLTITVNPLITPTFAAVAPICSGDPLAPLPTTSTNGINGTWAPALNNTATTTYTFTPAAGQCAVTTTLTITVNPLITPAFAAVAPICSGDPLAPLPTTSTNGINGTWAPALNNTATTTYTFTPAAGQCALTTTLTITVNPLITPAFAAVAPICSGDPLAPLPTTSTNGINGTWAPALNNTATTTYTFTPAAGQCAVTTTLTITVNPLITPAFAAVAPICSGDPLAPLPTTSTNGINGTWAPALNNTATTTYTFTPAAGQCALTTTLTITVNPLITPTFAAVAAICSGDPLAPLPTTSTNGINGTWTPALNNTATTTYTFTPAAGQCAVTTTLTITVNPLITPTFAAVAPICSGDPLAPLPTTSTNGINGTWAPALNNTATTTYTFTPAAGQCAVTTTLTITVNPLITPTFAAVAAICSGDPLAPLPTTSTNGINGTWAPALNNTATTTYTFTPAAGQCAVTTTLTITVNNNTTPTFNPVATICSGDPLAPLPTTSTNGINGTWAPALNNTATTTYTFTPAAGQCAVTTTLTITVNPLITPTFAAVAAICSGDPLAPLPTTSTNGINGTWAPALNNTATTTYTFTPAAGQCALTTTLTITVNPLITPAFAAVTPICSGDPLAPLPTTSTNGINGTWAPALNNTATTTYTFTPAAGQCAVTTTLTITVNPLITPTFAAVAPICSGDPLAPLPTTSTNGINGTWAPALNNTATTTYTFTPAAGQCAVTTTLTITVNPLITPTFAAVAPICSGDPLAPLPTTSTNGINGTWAPALNNTATTTYTFTPAAGQCAITTTLTITVNPILTPTINCGVSTTTSVTFNWAAVAGATGYTLSYQVNANPVVNIGAIGNVLTYTVNGLTAGDNVTVTVTPTGPAGTCFASATAICTANACTPPTANISYASPFCASVATAQTVTLTGTGTFTGGTYSSAPAGLTIDATTGDITPSTSTTGAYTVTYTIPASPGCSIVTATASVTITAVVTPAFAAVAPICSGDVLTALPTTSTNGINGTWAPALDNTTTTTYTFTPTAGQCATTTTLTITVNAPVTPTFTAVAPICSGSVLAPLPTTSTNGINGTWAPVLDNTTTTTYTFTPAAGQCATTTTLTITVNAPVTPTFTAVAPICSGSVLAPLPTTSTNGINGSWSPALDNTATTTYTFTPAAGQCATTTTLTITVNAPVTPTFTAVAPICSGSVLAPLSTTSTNGINGTWAPVLDNTTTTTYTFTPAAGQCATTTTLTITVNAPVTPTFIAVAPICSGSVLAPLPTTSTNGINGVWSPVLSNTATTTYTFTPAAGQCATTTTLTITVNPILTPTINCGVSTTTSVTFNWAAVAGATGYDLSYQVNANPVVNIGAIGNVLTYTVNGLTAGDNVTVTVTPTGPAGTCFASATAICTANACTPPAANISYASPFCASVATAQTVTLTGTGTFTGGTYSSAPAGLTIDAITGDITPSTSTPGTYTVTYTIPASPGCSIVTATASVTITTVVTPAFAAVAPICSGDPLAPLPTTSTNGINGSWAPALNNTATTTYTFTPAAGQCAATTTLTITVNPLITPTFAAIAPICSGDPLAPLPTTSTNGINGVWAPALDNTTTTTYTFTPTAGQCATTTTLTITVNAPVTPAFTAVAPICSGSVLAPLPTTSTNGINGVWSPVLSNTATTTYTFTPAAGQCATTTTLTITVNPILTPTINCGVSTTTSVTFNWAAVAGATGYTLSYQVNANPVVNIGAIGNVLTYTVNGLTAGDNVTVTVTPTGPAGTCFASATAICTANACTPPTANISYASPFCASVATAQTVTLTGTGTFTGGTYSSAPAGLTIDAITGDITPSTSTPGAYTVTYTIPASPGCSIVTATASVTITAVVTPAFAAVAPICSGDVLAPLPTTSTNGINGSWAPALDNTTTTTYTFTPTAGQCATTTTLTITVNAPVTPTFAAVAPVCSGSVLAPLPTTSTNGINGTWSPVLDNTTTTTYTFTPAAGQCATTTTLTITVNPILTPVINCGVSTVSSVTFNWVAVAGATGYTLSYQVNANPVVNIGAIGNVLTYTVNGLTAGDNVTVTVTPTGPAGTCFASATAICTANACTPPTANISYASPFCASVVAAQTVTLTGTGTFTGGTYSSAPAGLTIDATTGDITPSTSTPGTYTVTYTIPASPGCSIVTATASVTITAVVTPAFATTATMCSGMILDPLPTTSPNGITGTWSPALNNTTTTTYTFTPTAGQCATTTTLTITVNPILTPVINCGVSTVSSVTFNWAAVAGATGYDLSYQVNANPVVNIGAIGNVLTYTVNGLTAGDNVTVTVTATGPAGTCFASATAICTANACTPPTANISYASPYCASVAAAQTVTLTGTGTFTGGTYSSAPAGLTIDATTGDITPSTSTSGTYTVTYTIPASPGCSIVTATASVTITAVVTPAFAAVAPICSGDVLAPLPTTSTNGINGSWAPALDNTTTTTYTFTPTAGQCATTTTLTITVNAPVTPAFTAVAPVCSGSVLAPLPTTSTNGINGTWAPALDNTTTTTYTFTPAAGQCATTTTLTITVNPILAPVINCGVSTVSSVTFNWAAVAGATGYDLSYQVNANPVVNIGAIGNVLTYTVNGLTAGDNVTVTVTPTDPAGTCFASATAICTANACTPPAANISYASPFCASVATAQTVTLTGTGTFTGGTYSSAPAGLTIDAITGDITPSTSTPGAYTVTYTIPASPGCSIVTATASVTITAVVTPAFAAVAPICSGDVLTALPTTSTNGINGTWAPALDNTTTTTYTFTPAAGQCATTTTLTITVNPILTPVINCGVSTVSSVTFNWAAVAGATGYDLSYQVNANPVVNIGAIGNVLTYTVNGLTAGDNVTVTVTPTGPAGTCFASATAICTANACTPPTANISYASPYCASVATAQTVTLTGTGTFTGGTYSSAPAGLTIDAITGDITPSTSTPGAYTVTYTIPASPGCSIVTATASVTITAVVTPAFAAVAPICSGDVLTALPTTSTNGINGTWAPALDNTTTTTYTFTPAAGQCATTTTLIITVNAPVTPTFAAIAPICSGSVLAPLPTTSTNGINGVWSPALDNTTTTTYTFTPTAGQCATTTTLTITVNPILTPVINCGVSTVSSVTFNWATVTGATGYTLSYQVNANPVVNIGAIGNVLTYTVNGLTAGDNVTVTVTPTGPAGTCFASATAICTANACTPPTANISYASPYCASIAAAQTVTLTGTGTFTGGTYSSAPGGLTIDATTGDITPSTSTPGTYTVTYTIPASPGCSIVTATASVTITAVVTPAFAAVAPICSGDALTALPTTSTNGINGTWAPALDNTTTTTYTFTPTAGQCATIATLTITVNAPVTPTFTAVAPVCSGSVLAPLPTTSTNGINGTWSPVLDNTTTTTYTFTPTAGQCATTTTLTITVNPILTPVINCGVSTVSSVTFNWAAVAGATGYDLSYQVNANPVVNIGAIGNVLTYTVNGLTAGDNVTVTVTPTGPAGTCFASATAICTANPCTPPTASISYASPFCASVATAQTVTLTGTGTFTGGTYSSAPAGLTIDATTGSINPSTSTPGAYTVTYTIPASPGCSIVTATAFVTISAVVTPSFAPVAPICSGDVLAPLPTTSTNGINGSWAPALDNTTTTTYTFTPTAGQCATIATLTITVSPSTLPTFNPVAPICSGATLSPLPTTSTNGINGTWSPALNNTTTTTYTFTPTAGQCATTTTLTITVNAPVIPTFPPVAAICSGATLTALPTTSTNGINGTWSPALDNTATTTYTFTPIAGQCATTATLTITVNAPVIPTFPPVAAICSGATLTALPTTSTNGINGTWSPALNNTTTTTYTFTATAGQCATTATLTITVNAPVAPTFPPVAAICSGATLTALPTTSNNGINGVWSPALNNTATTTYTFTPAAGQCATTTTMTITVNANITPTFPPVAAICSGAALTALPTTSTNGINGVWSPALNNTTTTTYTFTPTAGQCATTTTLTITVNPSTTPTFSSVAPICTGTALTALPTTSNEGINGVWSPALNNTATTTYTFTPGGSQCATIATLTIVVYPVATSTTPVTICSSQLPYNWNGNTYPLAGTYSVTLTSSAGCDSIATLQLTATTIAPTSVFATTCENQLPYSWNGQSYPGGGSYQVQLTSSGGCDSLVTLNLAVNAISTSYTPATICSADLPYSWNGQSYSSGGTHAVTLTNSTGCDSIATLDLTVNQTPVLPAVTSPVTYCQHETTAQLTAGITTTGSQLVWYTTPTGGTGSATAPVPSSASAGSVTYYVSQANGLCEGPRTAITVMINSKPDLGPDKPLRICYGQSADLTPLYNTGGLTGNWTINQQPVPNPSAINVEGTYQLVIANSSGCQDTALVNLGIQPPVTANAGADDNAALGIPYQLNGSGTGSILQYQWSPANDLNNPFLANPLATLMHDETFVLMVSDEIGCFALDTVHLRVLRGPTFYVPNAFTPNGDGVNDIFRPTPVGIASLEYFSVYNRYGEKVFETHDLKVGWDGTYKGQKQPIDNYVWHLKGVDMEGNTKIMKGNVILIR